MLFPVVSSQALLAKFIFSKASLRLSLLPIDFTYVKLVKITTNELPKIMHIVNEREVCM